MLSIEGLLKAHTLSFTFQTTNPSEADAEHAASLIQGYSKLLSGF